MAESANSSAMERICDRRSSRPATPPPLGIDNLPLLIHDVVVLQHVLTRGEVSALHLLLRVFDGLRQRLGLESVLAGARQPLHENLNPLPAEQTHQIVVQRDEKLRGARVALSSGTASQLIIDTPRLVALCADDVKAAQPDHLFVLLLAFLLEALVQLIVLRPRGQKLLVVERDPAGSVGNRVLVVALLPHLALRLKLPDFRQG